MGISKTTNIILHFFTFPGVKLVVEEVISSCHTCAVSKNAPSNVVVEPAHVVTTKPRELLSINHFGPVSRGRGGLDRIFVITDAFSGYTKLYPVKSADTKSSIHALEKYIDEEGKPHTILSDNASCLTELSTGRRNRLIYNMFHHIRLTRTLWRGEYRESPSLSDCTSRRIDKGSG